MQDQWKIEIINYKPIIKFEETNFLYYIYDK